MNDSHDRDLLHDLLDGRLPEDQAERLRRRIESDSDLRRERDELARLLAELATLRDERIPRDLRDEVMAAARGERPSSRRPGPRRAWIFWAVPAAAAVLLAAAAALLRDHEDRSPPGESRARPRDGSESRRGEGTPQVDASSGESGETADGQAPPPPAAPANPESWKDATNKSDGTPPSAPANDLRPSDAEQAKQPAIRGAKPDAAPGTPPPPLPVEPPKVWRLAMSDREAGRAVEPRFEVEFAPLRSAVVADPVERAAALAELTSEQRAIVAPALKDSPERIVVLRLDSAGRESLLALAGELEREVEELVAVAGAHKDEPRFKDAHAPREYADAGIAWRRLERGPDLRFAGGEPIGGGADADKQHRSAGGGGEKSKPAARDGAAAGEAKGELGGLLENEKSASDGDRATRNVSGPSTPATRGQTLILILRP